MHPPEAQFGKAAPGIEYVHHIKTTQTSDQCGKARLGSEAVLNVVKKLYFLRYKLHFCGDRKQYGGDHRNTTDPQDHAQQVDHSG